MRLPEYCANHSFKEFMEMINPHIPKYALVKFNGGRGALLCNKCSVIIRQDFDPMDIEDQEHFCVRCQPRDPLGVDLSCHYFDGKCGCKSIEECKYG